MTNEILKRDQNHVTVLAGVTNDADQDVTMLRVDPITKRLLVAATGGGGGGVSSLNGLTGDITISAGTNITLNIVGDDIEISASGGGSGTVDSVVAGTGISVDNTDPANPIVSTTITQYTDEMAQDAVGTILTDSESINFSYDDGVPAIIADVNDDSITNARLANMATSRFKGRISSGTGDPEDLTVTQARSLLALVEMLKINTANSTAISNTTSETEFDITATLTNINTAGRTYLIFATGFLSTTGTPTLTIRLKGDATKTTTLWDSGAQTMGSSVTNRPWMCIWIVTTRATGASGSLHTATVYNRFDARSSNQAATDNLVDLTFDSLLAVTARWSAASSSNTVTLDTLCVLDLNTR